MTSKGYAFKDIANSVVVLHGFGSTKAVEEYPACMKSSCGCKYTEEDVIWLVDEGYLNHRVEHRTSRNGSRQSWGHYHETNHHLYGLTVKGWKVAKKYLEER